MPESAARAFCILCPVPVAGMLLGHLVGASPLVWLSYLLSATLTVWGVGLVVVGIARGASSRVITLVTIATLIAVAPLGALVLMLTVADPFKAFP
jgi:hypothetical protein